MTVHTTRTTVTFTHPFSLDGFTGPWPPGIYEVETDEEALDTPSMPVRRRIRTILYRQDTARGVTEAVQVAPEMLDEALRADAASHHDGAASPRDGAAGTEVETAPDTPPDTLPGTRPTAAKAERRGESRGAIQITPVWVVPLLLGLGVLLSATLGPVRPPVAGAPSPGQQIGHSPP